MLAVIILVFFVLTLGVRYTLPLPEVGLSRMGYEILEDLDKKGELRSYVVNNQTDLLESKIHIQGYNHTVKICDLQDVCSGKEPGGLNVWVSSYLISGENAYDPYEVRLFMW